MATPELQTINRLYLELSQFATAKTSKDLQLEQTLHSLDKIAEIAHSGGTIGLSVENALILIRKLSLDYWMQDRPTDVRTRLLQAITTHTSEESFDA